MWRLLLVGIASLGLAACGDELSVQEEFVNLMEKTREATFTVTYDYDAPEGPREPITWYRMGEFQRTDVKYFPGSAGPNQLTWVSGLQGTYAWVPGQSALCRIIILNMTRQAVNEYRVREPDWI